MNRHIQQPLRILRRGNHPGSLATPPHCPVAFSSWLAHPDRLTAWRFQHTSMILPPTWPPFFAHFYLNDLGLYPTLVTHSKIISKAFSLPEIVTLPTILLSCTLLTNHRLLCLAHHHWCPDSNRPHHQSYHLLVLPPSDLTILPLSLTQPPRQTYVFTRLLTQLCHHGQASHSPLAYTLCEPFFCLS